MGKGPRHVDLSRAILLACCACAFASDPSLDVTQNARTAWTRRDGHASADQDLPGANISDLTIEAGLAGLAEGKAHATPGRLRKNHAQGGGDTPVRDLKFTHLTTNDGLTQDNIVAILQDHRGFMWFATGGGLNRYDGNTFVVYQNNPDDPNTLSANDTQSLIEDDRGDLWIGNLGRGTRQVRSND